MPGKRRDAETQVTACVFSTEEPTRKTIHEAGMVDYEPKGLRKSKEHSRDPRESPQLIRAGNAGMKKVEVEEQTSLEVPTVNLHIHERVAPAAALVALRPQTALALPFLGPDDEGGGFSWVSLGISQPPCRRSADA